MCGVFCSPRSPWEAGVRTSLSRGAPHRVDRLGSSPGKSEPSGRGTCEVSSPRTDEGFPAWVSASEWSEKWGAGGGGAHAGEESQRPGTGQTRHDAGSCTGPVPGRSLLGRLVKPAGAEVSVQLLNFLILLVMLWLCRSMSLLVRKPDKII